MVQIRNYPEITLLPEGETAIEQAEAKMLTHVQPVTFLKHHFAPGIYVREIWMPKGAIILGHRHKTDHLNIIVQGAALVRMEGRTEHFAAPYTVRSGAGVRKALYILEDMIWMTVHDNPTDETDIATLDEMFTVKSESWKRHQVEAEKRAFKELTAHLR